MRADLIPGVNVDAVDRDAGLREAMRIGYGCTLLGWEERMVISYALWRWSQGEEDGAVSTWLSVFPRDFGSWVRIVAAARAATKAPPGAVRVTLEITAHGPAGVPPTAQQVCAVTQRQLRRLGWAVSLAANSRR